MRVNIYMTSPQPPRSMPVKPAIMERLKTFISRIKRAEKNLWDNVSHEYEFAVRSQFVDRETHMLQEIEEKLINYVIQANIRRRKKVAAIEFGSGVGSITSVILNSFLDQISNDQLILVGLDISREMIDLAKVRLKNMLQESNLSDTEKRAVLENIIFIERDVSEDQLPSIIGEKVEDLSERFLFVFSVFNTLGNIVDAPDVLGVSRRLNELKMLLTW